MTRTTLAPATIAAAIKAGAVGTLNDTEPGLRLWIGTGGTATWQWRGRDDTGRVRTFTLGHYPHVGLAEARRLARRMGHNVRYQGADPIKTARGQRSSAKALQGHTLAALLDLYGKQVGVNVKSWGPQMQPQIERVFRPHLEIPLASLTVAELQMTADSYAKPKSASFGVRCLLTVLRWATAPGRAYVDRAMLDLRATSAKPSRDRVLSREELAKLLPVLQASDSIYARALRLILLTAARRGEVEAARWQDVNLTAGTWTLPVTKNGQPHVIPLSRQASALLRGLQPAQATPEAFVFSTSGRALTAWDAATDTVQAASGTEGWQRHDLRRTAATLMGEMGVAAHVVEAALNHTDVHSPLASVYNRSRYRPEVADALQRLADALDGIEHGAAEVIRLPVR